eukprot:9497061-Pyramimonas_sp.AAC.1
MGADMAANVAVDVSATMGRLANQVVRHLLPRSAAGGSEATAAGPPEGGAGDVRRCRCVI